MKCNVGKTDKVIRVILGLILLAVAIFIPANTTVSFVLYILAAIALVTGFIRFCPLYQVLGINSCGKEKIE